jgi:hypothetical protein
VRAIAASVLASLLLLGALLGACTSGHTVLGTASSPCFKALPDAANAVHRRGTLLGVRRVTLGQLLGPRPGRAPSIRESRNETVCAVAYRGTFAKSAVEKGHGRVTGKLAVVLVQDSDNRVIATLVFDRLPIQFRHLGLL